MSEEWDGKVFMSTPGGPVVTMSLGDVLARKDDEIERLRAEIERLRAEVERLKLEPETLRAELIAICNASRAALANAYDRARESRKTLEAKP